MGRRPRLKNKTKQGSNPAIFPLRILPALTKSNLQERGCPPSSIILMRCILKQHNIYIFINQICPLNFYYRQPTNLLLDRGTCQCKVRKLFARMHVCKEKLFISISVPAQDILLCNSLRKSASDRITHLLPLKIHKVRKNLHPISISLSIKPQSTQTHPLIL